MVDATRFFGCMVASRGGYRMARGRHYAKLSLSNAARLSFSDLCILLFLFLSLCRLCVCVFLCSHWSLVDVPLIFFCPADHVPYWQPRVLLGMVEARSVNVKKTTTTTTIGNEVCFQRNSARDLSYSYLLRTIALIKKLNFNSYIPTVTCIRTFAYEQRPYVLNPPRDVQRTVPRRCGFMA